jgi:hypothetical protein
MLSIEARERRTERDLDLLFVKKTLVIITASLSVISTDLSLSLSLALYK